MPGMFTSLAGLPNPGSAAVAAASTTPGKPRTRWRISSTRAFLCTLNRASWSTPTIAAINNLDGSKPRSIRVRPTRLRVMRPAPTSSTIESATSRITRPARIRPRRAPPPKPFDAEASWLTRSVRDACNAGKRPHTTVVTIDVTTANISAAASRLISVSEAMPLCGNKYETFRSARYASTHPQTQPTLDNTKLSASNCWIKRARLAPSAARTAI